MLIKRQKKLHLNIHWTNFINKNLLMLKCMSKRPFRNKQKNYHQSFYQLAKTNNKICDKIQLEDCQQQT